MAIVMGLDQHRAQISAEWIDTVTGEVSRGRVVPADRHGVRKFLARFSGPELEVALEATTGWRFMVEELRRVGAEAHLAEPAQTSALRGNKQHAKNDRADTRHLRELLMARRLPECWIAPDHLLDLCAKVRLRHTLVDQRGEWQQRMQAVLYHHGVPKRAGLLTGENRAWLEQLPLRSRGGPRKADVRPATQGPRKEKSHLRRHAAVAGRLRSRERMRRASTTMVLGSVAKHKPALARANRVRVLARGPWIG